MQNRPDHPNMLGAAIFMFVLGLTFLTLSALALIQGQPVDVRSIAIAVVLFVLGMLALEKRDELAGMTPAQREAYWQRKDADWQKIADSRARAELGDDYERRSK